MRYKCIKIKSSSWLGEFKMNRNHWHCSILKETPQLLHSIQGSVFLLINMSPKEKEVTKDNSILRLDVTAFYSCNISRINDISFRFVFCAVKDNVSRNYLKHLINKDYLIYSGFTQMFLVHLLNYFPIQ